MRLGIFGGSFDPVHNGHLALARAALQGLPLDGVLFVPAFAPPHKPRHRLAPAADRLAMLDAAFGGSAGFLLSRIEVDRAGPVYTIDTVRELQAAYGPSTSFVLLMGWDSWLDFPQWHDAATLRTLVEIAAAPRPGTDASPHSGVLRIPSRPLAISSRAIRARVERGEDIGDLVPHAVSTYIALHGLYRHV